MTQVKSKLPGVGTTIFTTMSGMASEYNAINLSQGYPDFSAPQPLLDLVTKYLNDGYNQYPPMMGVEYLRQEISRKMLRLYGVDVDLDDEVTVTSGATEALFVAIQTIINVGDEVIVFDPAYDSYEPAVTLAGGKTVHVSLDSDFNINWQSVADAITPKTQLIIINSPHNPSGSIITPDDIKALVSLVENTNIFLISDEVYEHMVYDGQQHLSLLAQDELRSRTFVVSSFGKTYHATGWKIAYCIAPRDMTVEFRKIHQFVTFTTHTASQWALAEFLENCPEHYLELPDFYQQKRDLFLKLLEPSGFKMIPTRGTYFQLAEYSELSDQSDVAFVTYLTQQVGVAAIPISVFYESPPDQSVIRFCFAKDETTLALACDKLIQLKAQHVS